MNRFVCILLSLQTIFAVSLSSCREDTCNSGMVLIIDQTDSSFSSISENSYRQYSVLTKNQDNGEQIRIRGITETGFSPDATFAVPQVTNSMFGNSDARRKRVLPSYYKNVDSVLSGISSGISERDGSAVFKVISEELTHLACSNCNPRVLICKSDLLEKSSLADFYSSRDLGLLHNHPDTMQKRFLTKYPLPDLSGITVYLSFRPRDQTAADRFELVSGFYSSLLESLGATVIVTGDF